MSSAGRPEPGMCRLTLELPAELVEWIAGFAEISHRTVEDVVRPLIEEERARVEAGWDTGCDAGDPR
ncbi:hypothetical protein [Streptomyces sp. NBC_01615]|uniref:hypothetical protein n=1 Tax=Streptomyces sp. NBC_01615 TaxID=2975898 RepID=UPI003864A6C7